MLTDQMWGPKTEKSKRMSSGLLFQEPGTQITISEMSKNTKEQIWREYQKFISDLSLIYLLIFLAEVSSRLNQYRVQGKDSG